MSESTISNFKVRLEELVLKNIHREDLDNLFLARALCTSEAGFYRRVKQAYNVSPNHLVRKMRLREAEKLLSTTKKVSVKEAAYSVGFTHVGYFIRRYEEYYGHRPGDRERAVA